MKSIKLLFFFFLLSASSLFCVGQSKEIQSVIDITKGAIFSAAADLKKDGNLPKLKSVIISLEIAVETAASGGLSIYVVSAGAEVNQSKTQKINIELKPDFNIPLNISSPNLGKQLKNLILETAKGIANANKGITALSVEKVELEIGLTIERSGEGGINFDIGIVKLEAGGSVAKTNSTSVKLIFEK
jgi:Trypsin-co-occurring domain 2